jgi:hypothetical protein
LKEWDQELKDALRADIASTTEIKLLFTNSNNKLELAEAWKLLKKAGRIGGNNLDNGLTRNPKALQALAGIRKNPYLKNLSLDDNILSNIKGHAGASYDAVIDDLNTLATMVGTNPNTIFTNFEQCLSILRGENVNYRQGVHWMIRDVGSDKATFSGKTLKFEFRVSNANENNAYIDLLINDNPFKYIEFKSGPGSITRTTFIDQFINRDLLNVDQIDQIEWRITGRNLTKQEVITYMSSDVGKSALNKSDIVIKFDSFAESIGYSTGVNTVEELLLFLNSDDKWFNLIFKNK